MVQRKHWRCLLLLLVLLLGACGAATPEQAAQQTFGIQRQRIAGTRPLEQGFLVLQIGAGDNGVIPATTPPLRFGYSVVPPYFGGWRAQQASSGEFTPSSTWKADFVVSRFGEREGPVFVVGQTIDPAVQSVEVTFADGETVRDQVTAAMFAAVSESGAVPCRVRLLDGDGAEMQALNVVDGGMPEDLQDQARRTCP